MAQTMAVELPEEACPCQEESSRKKRKHNDEDERSSSSSSVDTEAVLGYSRSDSKPCSETDAQMQELNGNCDQSGESTCLPLKKRQRVQEEKNGTAMNNNQCGVDLSGDMGLCPANEAQLDIEKEDINGDFLCHSDTANCSQLQNGNSGDKAVVEGESEAILVRASLETASADTPAYSAGMEPMLKEGDFKDLKLHSQDGTQKVQVSKSSAPLENKDSAEVQFVAEHHKSHVDQVSEATCIGNGGALPLSTTASQEKHIMEVDTDNKQEAIPSTSQDLSKDEKDLATKEDLLGDSSHVSAPEDSKKKLLILDLNGLLADIIPYCNERYKHDFEVSHKYVYKRPHVDDFLQFCFERFTVAVWSSRTKRNIDPLLELLIGPLQTKLLFCWDQSHCTQTRFTTVDNKEKPLVFKELSKVWEMHSDDLPWKKGQYNESNTLLLDDSPYKALLNPANTAIFPMSYRYTRIHDNSLGPGGDLRGYLEGLAVADNVQDYVKNNPFGQKAITESDPSWQYYQRVLRSYPHQDHTKEAIHRDDAGKWSHRNDAGKWAHRCYDDSRWSHHDHDASGRWSHRYDDRRWSHRDDDRRWSHRDDGRRWSRDYARGYRHEDARRLPRDYARDQSRRDYYDGDYYAGKSPKRDTRESETRAGAGAVGEFTSTANLDHHNSQ